MSDETQHDDDESATPGGFRRPWFLSDADDDASSIQDAHDWRTAAEVVDAESDTAEKSAEPDEKSDEEPASDEDAKSDDDVKPDDGAKPDDARPEPPSPPHAGLAFPEGLVDLTEETENEDSVRIPATAYHDRITEEPVHGTVEVDRSVSQPNETVIMPVESPADDRRAARARALGEVDPGADVITAPVPYSPPAMYNAWPSFALFVFRLVIATVLSIRATEEIWHLTQTKATWATSILPSPDVWAVGQIIVEYLIALMLLLGLASRVAGLLLIVLYVIVLSFITWGAVNPFVSGLLGFRGEYEVMMVVIGLVFAGIGGGSAAVDGAVHRARLDRKNAKLGFVKPEEEE